LRPKEETEKKGHFLILRALLKVALCVITTFSRGFTRLARPASFSLSTTALTAFTQVFTSALP
jgi:hypothetical protein